MKIKYTIDLPKNAPCWEVNKDLWKDFSLDYYNQFKRYPAKDQLYTEQYVVQLCDITET